jgi:hypothetical protein
MYGKVGSSLRQREDQYVALRDKVGTWRIMDTHNPSLENMSPDEDVPDDHEAITVLSEGQFLTVVTEANKLGLLLPAEADIDDEEVEELKKEIEELKTTPPGPQTESYLLKTKVIDALERMVVAGDIKAVAE